MISINDISGTLTFHFACCLSCAKSTFFCINSYRNTIRVSNSLDLDQARRFVGPRPKVIKLFHAQLN